MGLLTDGITNFLMKTVFSGTAKRIDAMIDPKGRQEVIDASNEYKKSLAKFKKHMESPGMVKELKEMGKKAKDFPFYVEACKKENQILY